MHNLKNDEFDEAFANEGGFRLPQLSHRARYILVFVLCLGLAVFMYLWPRRIVKQSLVMQSTNVSRFAPLLSDFKAGSSTIRTIEIDRRLNALVITAQARHLVSAENEVRSLVSNPPPVQPPKALGVASLRLPFFPLPDEPPQSTKDSDKRDARSAKEETSAEKDPPEESTDEQSLQTTDRAAEPLPDAQPETPPRVTQAELAAYAARFKNATNWTYGERTPGELEGTWLAVHGKGQPIMFSADGTCSEDFAGKRAQGLYAISAEGRVVTCVQSDGVRLSSHYRLEGARLTGPSGANPMMNWLRQSQ